MGKKRSKKKFIYGLNIIHLIIISVIFVSYTFYTSQIQAQTSDTTPPIITIISPSDGSIVPRGTAINLISTYSDESPIWLSTSKRNVKAMEFYVNGKLACRTAAYYDEFGGFGCYWKTFNNPNYQFTVYAQAYDVAGNLGKSPQITLTTSQ